MKDVPAKTDRGQPKNGTEPKTGWSRETMLVLVVFTLHAVIFTWYTGQIWEDYFITFKFSQNLAEGRGLTYDGEHRIHGFTSPLGTLLPAFFHWMLRATSYEPALYAYRVLSILAYAAAGALLHDFLAKRHRGGRWTAWTFVLLFLLDAKSVAFSTNGMETGIMLFFVALAFIRSQTTAVDGWRVTGLVWAGLLWTRPDGCVYVGVFAVIQLLQASMPLWNRVVVLIRQSVLAGLAYLPWFLFATFYFGSPVPQTVRAKSMFWYKLEHLINDPKDLLFRQCAEVFAPIYGQFGYTGWWMWLEPTVSLFAAIAVLAWILPLRDRIGRSASLATFLLLAYAIVIPAFPWYFPPLAMLACVSLACVIGQAGTARPRWLGFPLAAVLGATLLLHFAYMDYYSFYQVRIQQHYIEWGTRKKIAVWLKERGDPSDTVYLECLGYIGFFSGLEMLDFPGLVSPPVVEARRRHAEAKVAEHGYSYAFYELQPNWLVARPHEYLEITNFHPDFLDRYELAQKFDVYGELEQLLPFPGSQWPINDSRFAVFRRKDLSDSNDLGEESLGEDPEK